MELIARKYVSLLHIDYQRTFIIVIHLTITGATENTIGVTIIPYFDMR